LSLAIIIVIGDNVDLRDQRKSPKSGLCQLTRFVPSPAVSGEWGAEREERESFGEDKVRQKKPSTARGVTIEP